MLTEMTQSKQINAQGLRVAIGRKSRPSQGVSVLAMKAPAWDRAWHRIQSIFSQPQGSKTHVTFASRLMLVKLLGNTCLLTC